MSKRSKHPIATQHPPDRKSSRHVKDPSYVERATVSWQFSTLDVVGPFGWLGIGKPQLLENILPKIKNLETMTWKAIGTNGSHPVALNDLDKTARDRLAELNLDDIDHLYSLRLSGTERVWGILDRSILKVLWWDPDHQVCPAAKKHT